MTELKSEELKNAIAAQLLRIAPECAVYKEAITIPAYPHFFVHLISVRDEEERKNRHNLTHSFDLRYRVKSDPSTDLKLEQNLDAMALKLTSGFNIIDCNDIKVRCENKNFEKIDGVLHFYLTIQVDTYDMQEETPCPKMETLTETVGVKE